MPEGMVTQRIAIGDGNTAIANASWYKGIKVYDNTGDAVWKVYKNTSAVDADEIDVAAPTDETQVSGGLFPGDYVVNCKAKGGLFIVPSGADSYAIVYYGR